LPRQGKKDFVGLAPWAMPTAKMGLRFQRGRSEPSMLSYDRIL
jgi:hypothetical protein